VARADEGSIKIHGQNTNISLRLEATPQTLTETFSDEKPESAEGARE
jgi:hypothetical protein